MRFCFVTSNPLSTVSGGFIYNQTLIQHLRASGDEVEVITIRWQNPVRNFAVNWSRSMLRTLSKPFDVILQDEVLHLSLFRLNRRLRDQPKAAIVHHLRCREARARWKQRAIGLVERTYLASVEAHVFNSEATRSDVRSLVNLERPSIVAYPAGDRFQADITPEEILARCRQSGPLRLFFVGNLVPRKGLLDLVEAVGRLPAGIARLDVAGNAERNPAYVRRVERLIVERGVGDRVSLLGRLSEDELAQRYRENHVMVVPSGVEGFGIVYAEGMAFGLPAIACADAAREIVDDGTNGFMVQQGDVDALSRRIQRFSEDRDLLATMSVAARERFLRHPTWQESCERIRRFLCSLARP